MVAKYFKILKMYLYIGKKSMMEYLGSNIIQIVISLINTSVWIVFWSIFFNKFSNTTYWKFEYIFLIWTSLSLGLCLLGGFFGNVREMTEMICDGRIEFFMLHPLPTFFHLFIANPDISELIEGGIWIIVYAIYVKSVEEFVIFLVISILICILLLGYLTILGGLSFFVRMTQGFVDEVFNFLITFSTYPYYIFNKFVKTILFTLIPAGFISYVPVQILFTGQKFWLLILGTVAISLLFFGILICNIGIKKYEGMSQLGQKGK